MVGGEVGEEWWGMVSDACSHGESKRYTAPNGLFFRELKIT